MRFASAELRAAARRVAHQLQRLKASGIYGDQPHRTLWNEFCFEIENGQTPGLEMAWEHTLDPLVADVVNRLPDHTARLLSWHAASFEEEDPEDALWPDLVCAAVLSATKQLALRRT